MALAEAFLAAKTLGNMQGCEVDVICAETGKKWQGNDSSLDEYVSQRFNKICRIRQPIFAKYFRFRLFPLLANLPDILVYSHSRMLKALRSLAPENYDAMVSWSQWHSVHLVALNLKRQFPGLRWMAHFSDPWVDNAYMNYGHLERLINGRMERRVIDGADRVSFTTRQTADVVMRKYPSEWGRKVTVHPHPYDPSLYELEPERLEQQQLVLRYIGTFYGPRSPEPLFRALRVISEENPYALQGVSFELVGVTPVEFLRTESYQALPNGLVKLVSPVEYKISLRLMAQSQALLLIDAPGSESVFLPSKLIDYIGAGRPIFGITPSGTSADLIAQLGGFVANPGDVNAIAEGLLQTLDALRGRWASGEWGNSSIRNKFSVESVSADFKEAIFDEGSCPGYEA
jgi:glycosyltransferase involved in cell wall biosynthesis